MRITRGITAVAALAALSLTGCAAGDAATQESSAPQGAATPTKIKHPDDQDSCTVTIEHDVTEGDSPDLATIQCGTTAREVAGNFADKTSNWYAPESGVSNIVVVGTNVRAWVYTGEGENTCAIIYDEGDQPVKCRPTEQGESSPEPINPTEPERMEAPTA